MSIELDVVIDAPENSVDMKAGLDTLQGVSDATRCITETLLTEKVPQRLTHTSKVRTTLKQTFKGSYGHIFSVDVYDQKLKEKFNSIGRIEISELISYFISESLYKESKPLSIKSQKVINSLGETSEKLVQQLRISALRNIHEIPIKFNYDVKVRLRNNRDDQIILGKFDLTTAAVLQARKTGEKIDLSVGITRLNINTGNGRLLPKGENETVAFGFGIGYRAVKLEAKKLFSENLDHNNGLKQEEWKLLKISVSPIALKDGKIVKYIIMGFYND
jgi:hypothetical protein